MEKYEFSQEDYSMYRFYFATQKEDKILGVASKSVKHKHDKTFKSILKNKNEMSKFLKQFIGMEVDVDNLEVYDNSFLNKQYEKRESDIIYVDKSEEIYYLIEHQSSVDKKMPFRILEYCMELMKKIKENQKIENGKNPLIIPIVIYTGTDKWNVSTNFSDTQYVEEKYKEYAINLKYKLIDINKYSKEELKEINTKMSTIMILEKCKNRNELKETVLELWKKSEEERKIWIKSLVKYVFTDILGNETEIILKIIEEEGNRDMQDLIERIKRNEELKEKRLRAEGRADGIFENIMATIKNMLKYNEDDETIMKYTNAKKEDIDKVRRELGMQNN